ncbi:hypothetical protein FRACYDRAFT_197417, partial [Fragilariopsis cylindrus CCMP1102]
MHDDNNNNKKDNNNNNNNENKNNNENENTTDDDDGIISACLLIMDDNHYLIEWIAYHYYVMNLRRLIIAIDPKSLVSPISILNRWKQKGSIHDMKIDITIWKSDSDYTSKEEFDLAKQKIKNEFTELPTNELIEHRARQRLFYTHCLRELKQPQQSQPNQNQSQSSWTMLIDVDEFIRVNYKLVEQESRKKNTTTNNNNTEDADNDIYSSNNKSPLFYLQSSPCIQIPRYRFVSSSSSSSSSNNNSNNNSSNKIIDTTTSMMIDPNNFLTQKYRNHAKSTDYKKNKISKTIIDLRRISLNDIIEVNSIHMPIRKYCSQRNLHIQPKESLLVINHYLGSFQQFTYRDNDARNIIPTTKLLNNNNNNNNNTTKTTTKVNVRDAIKFKEHQKLSYPSETDDEIRPWLEGF